MQVDFISTFAAGDWLTGLDARDRVMQGLRAAKPAVTRAEKNAAQVA